MRRVVAVLGTTVVAFVMTVAPVAACGGLIGPNGAVNLLRTTTLAAYHDGVEHYVTAFQFAGGGGKFGSITPLPGIPTSVEKGGDWTLQRLIRETTPLRRAVADEFAPVASGAAEELLKVRIDALDLTVLRGGAASIGTWATAHGFRLPPDSPEVLDFYASRSPIFLAAAFDADAAAARGQQIGDGTPVHITIPTPAPWVPLRILALGKNPNDRIDADVFLLTDSRPNLLPSPIGLNGLNLAHDAAATASLLDDLRSDRGMSWVAKNAWLTKIAIDANASQLSFDLAIDPTGRERPSLLDAGLVVTAPPSAPVEQGRALVALLVVAAGLAVVGATMLWRRPLTPLG